MLNTKYLIGIFVIIFLISNCTKQEKIKPAFQFIDLTGDNGGNIEKSLKIDSLGNFFIRSNGYEKGEEYFKGILSDTIIDKLNREIFALSKIHIDSVPDTNCSDCGSENIIIKTEKFQIVLYAIEQNNQQLKNLDKLIGEIFRQKKMEKFDTTIIFKTRPPRPIMHDSLRLPDLKKH